MSRVYFYQEKGSVKKKINVRNNMPSADLKGKELKKETKQKASGTASINEALQTFK